MKKIIGCIFKQLDKEIERVEGAIAELEAMKEGEMEQLENALNELEALKSE